MAFTGKLFFSIVASAIGSAFQHGYNTGVMNNPQHVMTQWLNETMQGRGLDTTKQSIDLIWSIITAIYALGGMFGALLVGLMSRYFGLKWSLVLNNILVVVSTIFILISYFAELFESLIIARLILGFNSGIFAGLCPMYLNEISPVDKRGAIASVYQLVITISILIAQLLGYEKVLGGSTTWVYLIGIIILVPCIFQCLSMPFCPESPRYLLIIKKDQEKTQKALKWLRNSDDNQEEILDMQKEASAQEAAGSVTWKAMFTKRSLRTPLIISLVIMLAQQFSGINAIIVYSNEIFHNAGLDDFWSALGTVIIGIVNVLMTIVSLILVDHLGRKTLLLIGFSGTTIFMILLAICIKFSEEYKAMGILCIIFVVCYIISFATGPGSVPWFLVTELFKQDARPKATSLAVFTNWLANFIVMLAFLPLKYYMGYFVFLIFIVLQIIFLIFIIFKVPETKNKHIEEITSLYSD